MRKYRKRETELMPCLTGNIKFLAMKGCQIRLIEPIQVLNDNRREINTTLNCRNHPIIVIGDTANIDGLDNNVVHQQVVYFAQQ
jgi:hypothetical protein